MAGVGRGQALSPTSSASAPSCHGSGPPAGLVRWAPGSVSLRGELRPASASCRPQGVSRGPAHRQQGAGPGELAGGPVLADLSPLSIQESHPPLPHSAGKPLEGRRVKLLARSQAAGDPGQLRVLSFRVLSHVSFLLLPLTEETLSFSSARSGLFEEEGGCYHLLEMGRGF